MKMRNAMPPPMTDPLQMPAEEPGVYAAAHNPTDEAAERQHEAISRGMPARNFKGWAILAVGAVATAYMLWPKPSLGEKKPIEVTEISVTPGSSIVEQLKSDSRATPPQAGVSTPEGVDAIQPTPAPKVGLGSGANSGTDGDGGFDRDSPETRQAAITASSMEASEVKLSSNDRKRITEDDQRDPRSALSDMLDRQNGIIQKAMSQGDGGSRGDMPQRLGAQEEFLLRAKEKVIEPATTMAEARKPNSLYQGTIVRVVLERSINTDSPGAIRGRVMSDVLDSLNQQTLLIPRGSTLIGSYKSSMLVGQARVLIAAERIILPNGKSVNLLGTPVADMQGASGLPADVDNHFWEMFRTSFIVGAASLLLPKDQQNISISEGTQGNTKTGGSILGTALYDTIKQVSERNKGIGPTGTVDLGEPFTLMLSRDIEMEPYRKPR